MGSIDIARRSGVFSKVLKTSILQENPTSMLIDLCRCRACLVEGASSNSSGLRDQPYSVGDARPEKTRH